MKDFTEQQKQELYRLKQHFPYRIIYGVIDKGTGEFGAYAVTSMRIPNKLARQGHIVAVLKSTGIKNPPKKKIHDIEEETPIMPEVAADSVANKVFGYLYQAGEKKAAQFVYDNNLKIVTYLSENLKRVYAHNERFRNQMKRIKTIDKVHAFMEHWLAGWLKDNAPWVLKSLPSGFGWSMRLNPAESPYYYHISTDEALNAKIGKPAKSIWETSIVGYTATIWRKMQDGSSWPEKSKQFGSHKEAEQWSKKEIKRRM